MKEGYVPQTIYFLWDNDEIVGMFKLSHYLNKHLINGAYMDHENEEEYYTRIKI